VVAPGVDCLTLGAWTLWCLGYPRQALAHIQEALTVAQALAHPRFLANVQHAAAVLYHRRHEVRAVQAQAEPLLALALQQGVRSYVGVGSCWQGWLLAMQGQGDAGLALMHQGLAVVLAAGMAMTRPLCLLLLAEAAGHAGHVSEGLRLLEEALTAFAASERG